MKNPNVSINELMNIQLSINFDMNDHPWCPELKEVMSKLGEELNDFQISEMIREADKDGDGEIDFDEFVRMVTC